MPVTCKPLMTKNKHSLVLPCRLLLPLRVGREPARITQELARNAESQVPPKTHCIRSCTLTRSQVTSMHIKVENTPSKHLTWTPRGGMIENSGPQPALRVSESRGLRSLNLYFKRAPQLITQGQIHYSNRNYREAPSLAPYKNSKEERLYMGR